MGVRSWGGGLRPRSSRIFFGVLAAGVALAVAGCSGGGGGGSHAATQNPDNLTIAVGSTPLGLNPATGGNGDPISIYYKLAYDPLVRQQADGSFKPALATKWGFVGKGNKVYELTLRKGVKFSDGSDLTAEGVKAFFQYQAEAGGPNADRVQNFESIEATGPLQLRITLKKPNPQLTYFFSQDNMTGDVISPTAIKSPKKLGTETAGAGQYVLDSASTVTNQTYVYKPNPDYWDPSAVHWKTVAVKVMDNTAALNAMRAGQVDYTIGQTTDIDTAKSAGFTVTTQPATLPFMNLMDRDGAVSKALGDVRVRQALNYAIDRAAVAKALYGDNATPSDQMAVPGTDGYNKSVSDRYGYDVDKAKKLLAEAGYGSGLTIDLTAFNVQPGETEFAQAVASYWEKIGVTINMKTAVSLDDYVSAVTSKKFPATPFFYGPNPMYLTANDLLSVGGPGVFFNPFGTKDAKIDALVAAGAAASPDEASAIYQELQARLVDQAWFVPVAVFDKVVISRPGLGGVEMTAGNTNPDPLSFTPPAK